MVFYGFISGKLHKSLSKFSEILSNSCMVDEAIDVVSVEDQILPYRRLIRRLRLNVRSYLVSGAPTMTLFDHRQISPTIRSRNWRRDGVILDLQNPHTPQEGNPGDFFRGL